MLGGPHAFHLTKVINRIFVFYYKDGRMADRQIWVSELFMLTIKKSPKRWIQSRTLSSSKSIFVLTKKSPESMIQYSSMMQLDAVARLRQLLESQYA